MLPAQRSIANCLLNKYEKKWPKIMCVWIKLYKCTVYVFFICGFESKCVDSWYKQVFEGWTYTKYRLFETMAALIECIR